MTKLCDMPAGTKLLCIKGFIHAGNGGSWSGIQRLTQGKYYTKANPADGHSVGIALCDAMRVCFWGNGEEHFVAAQKESGTLLERLRSTRTGALVNPDGPEAATLIELLQRQLAEAEDLRYEGPWSFER